MSSSGPPQSIFLRIKGFFSKSVPEFSTQREFFFGNNNFNIEKTFASNFIKTSKYTIITFFPYALIIQFRRYANIYFLLTAILQTIPDITPLSPISGWAPLIVVLGLSIIREGIEDYYRHKSDIELNSAECKVYDNGKFKEKKWADLVVGDIVLVEEMEAFPADLIVLATNQETGICYIETSSLDGEKNLKAKLACKETCDKFIRNSEHPIFRLEGKISCQKPQPNLYEFEGRLFMKDMTISLNEKQLLLRGAVLKNSKWIIGIATYTGSDSKVMLNANPSKYKQSQVESKTNSLILFILVFELFCCLISALGSGYWNARNSQIVKDLYEFGSDRGPGIVGFLTFFTYFLLNNTMIPISLIVSLEMVKLAQAYLIEKDIDLFDKEKNRFARVFTSSINEELGQIEYIFTDKTGTLTCNKMEFKLALIGKTLFGDVRLLRNKKESKSTNKRPTYVDKKEGIFYSFEDKQLENLLRGEQESTKYSLLNYEIKDKNNKKVLYSFRDTVELSREYFKLLSTCHECLIDSEKNENMMRYQGPSPDEIALVDTARHLGFSFFGSTTQELRVEWLGEKKTIQLLNLFEFNSDRKRMCVIIKDDNIIKLYGKGADNIMKERLNTVSEQPFLEEVSMQLDNFAKKGFRTLVLAMRIIEEDEYNEFSKLYKEYNGVPEKKKQLEAIINNLETGFFLLGVTAVEDKLQDQVPETIHDFLKANIKVWMLTGDKMETAENIGRSCNLIQDHFGLLKLAYNKEKDTKELIIDRLSELLEISHHYNEIKQAKAFLLEGGALDHISQEDHLMKILLEIAKDCEAVICCRMIPKQKADIVKLVKDNLKRVTLSIGDGANDVNMIQEAHIGVGLYGEEGMRAVQASDFALVRFKGLWKLIFVHGKWSYIRISEMILYFFYKNMVFTICQFYFSFNCAFSGQTIFDEYYITFYNLLFTAMPLIIRAIIEQDIYYKFPITLNKELLDSFDDYIQIGEKQLLKKYYPKLYYIGQQNTLFTYKNFFMWVWQGLCHGLLIFLFCLFNLGSDIAEINGYNTDLWLMSITMYTSIILVVNIKLSIYTQYWTIITVLTLFITSYGFYFAYIWISDQFLTQSGVYQTASLLFKTPAFYFTVFGCMGIVFAFDLFIMFFKADFQMDLIEKVKIGVKYGYDRSETFFKNLFEGKTIDISENRNKSLGIGNEIEIAKLKEDTNRYSSNAIFKEKEKYDGKFKKIELYKQNNE